MKKIVEYRMPKSEFDGLLAHLREDGKYEAHGYFGMRDRDGKYEAHGYFGMGGRNTIDDGSSTDFDRCKRFSTFRSADDNSLTLRVEDSGLAQTIDSYFANQQ